MGRGLGQWQRRQRRRHARATARRTERADGGRLATCRRRQRRGAQGTPGRAGPRDVLVSSGRGLSGANCAKRARPSIRLQAGPPCTAGAQLKRLSAVLKARERVAGLGVPRCWGMSIPSLEVNWVLRRSASTTPPIPGHRAAARGLPAAGAASGASQLWPMQFVLHGWQAVQCFCLRLDLEAPAGPRPCRSSGAFLPNASCLMHPA